MAQARKVKVALLKPHTDEGRDYLPGHVIELNEGEAKWLVQIGTAEIAPANRQPTPAQ